jgi:serralysin
LPGTVERLVASGNSGVPGLELRGNALNNEIIGNVRDDTLRGEAGNDVLRGGDGHDRLYGGLGADVLDGGNGIDQARYDEADYAGFTVSLENPAINTGPAAGDTFSFVETLILSSGDDLAYGNGVQNTLEGRAGNDFLFGRANIDALYGEGGNDHLFGGTEADLHDGGDGFDYARYDDAAYASFVVSLAMPSINTGVAAGDTFVSIEGLMLGTGDDVGHGNSGANFIYGRDGNDTLYGKEGNDTLFGEAGADRFIFDTSTRDLDVIGDFVSGTDDIGLSSQFYGAANTGGGTVRFAQGAAPATATAQATIYYDTTNHLLSYSDSSGSFRIVELTGVASVTQSDLFFV